MSHYKCGPEFLRQILPPTLYLWGEADPFGGVDIGQKCVAAQPKAILQSFPASGHLTWLDARKHMPALSEPFCVTRCPDFTIEYRHGKRPSTQQ